MFQDDYSNPDPNNLRNNDYDDLHLLKGDLDLHDHHKPEKAIIDTTPKKDVTDDHLDYAKISSVKI